MRPWIAENKQAFERDVLLDFCLAVEQLEEQFARLERTGALSFPILKELVGEPTSKGLLWRLKDKAHLLFRESENAPSPAALLDWTLGYIFHESLKLMEDAHQNRHYAPALEDFLSKAGRTEGETATLTSALRLIVEATGESMKREALRLQTLFSHSRRLFRLYFAGRADHAPLARLFFDKEELLRKVFGREYDGFLAAVYGEAEERLYFEAALALFAAARNEEAERALEISLRLNPAYAPALALRERKATPPGSRADS